MTVLKQILEAAIFSADDPMTLTDMQKLFSEHDKPDNAALKAALQELQADYENRGIELAQVASGYRFQTRQAMSQWLSRFYQDKPQRYSRALLETLAIIVYRQPITRADIEDIRGVSVSATIIKTLIDREWIKVVGHKEVPGRPELLATTKQFLDYFNLTSLDQLPPLADIRNLDALEETLQQLDEESTDADAAGSETAVALDVAVKSEATEKEQESTLVFSSSDSSKEENLQLEPSREKTATPSINSFGNLLEKHLKRSFERQETTEIQNEASSGATNISVKSLVKA